MGKSKKGFTLIEMMVVVFIIALLASIIIVTVNRARQDSRDAKRKADLASIKTAVEMYYDQKASYVIKTNTGATTGWNGTSRGWFNCADGGSYINTIASGLSSNGFLNPAPYDPLYPATTCARGSYMYYVDSATNKYSIYAHLEHINDANADGYDDTSSTGTAVGYTMNYRVGNGY